MGKLPIKKKTFPIMSDLWKPTAPAHPNMGEHPKYVDIQDRDPRNLDQGMPIKKINIGTFQGEGPCCYRVHGYPKRAPIQCQLLGDKGIGEGDLGRMDLALNVPYAEI